MPGPEQYQPAGLDLVCSSLHVGVRQDFSVDVDFLR